MSNIIPPLLSDSPPPIITPEDEEDEFGDFNSAVEVSYGYENLSLPSTPQHEPLEDVTKIENFDINSNTDNIKDIKYKNQINGLFSIHIDKDFQDKRKSCDITTALNKTDVNLPKSECEEKTVYNVNFYENSDISCNGDHHAEKLKNFKDVEGGVLPNESVPIDTLIQNQLLETENENIHKSIDEINMKNENIIISVTEFSANVPCSTNENLLDTLKTDTKEINVLHIDSSLNNESRVTNLCNSGLESSEIVPNKVGANEDNVVENKSSTTMKEFYFIEEPPDLHVVDDSKVQVEDFCYYDAYEDEHNLDKHNFEISNKMNETCNEDSSISKMEDAVESLRALSETLDEYNDNSVQDEKTSSSQSSNDERIKKYVDDDLEKVEFTFATLNDASDINNENNLTNVSICKNNSHEFNKLSDNAGSLPTEELVKNNSQISLSTKANESIHIIAEDETNEAIITEVVNHFEEPNDTVDNFCDFQEIKISTPIEVVKDNDIVSDATNNDISEFSDFVDFARFDDANLVNEFTTDVEKLENNFTEISSHSNQTSVEPTFSDEEDEFGDFGDYTQTKFNITPNAGHATSTTTAPIMKINREDILQNVERIVLEMYPPCEVSYDKFVCADVLRTDSVFKSVKDVTETNALIYQWTKSTSQDKLLSALNIDTRNILYGAGWNPMMPRYAANLGSAPLEPIKSGDIGPSSSHIDSIHVQSSPSTVTQVDIPNAQFDWSGSGLINPLDSQPKDNSQRNNDQDFTLDQLEKNTDNLTPVLRARFHSDNESVKSLQLTTDTIQDTEETSTSKSESNTATFENDSFDEFTSYQSHKSVAFTPSCLSNTIPLRETYISGNCSTSDEFLQKNGEKIESNVSGKIEDGDEEFSDFQTGLPILSTVQKEPDKRGAFQDEFSVVNKNCGPGLQHVLEPLKPVVMINVNKEVAKEQTQINWPNPGIIDEDILNIELSYSRKQSIPLEVEKTVDEPNISNKASEIAKQQGVRCDMPNSFPDFAQLNKNKKYLISNSSSDNQKKDKQHIRNDKSKFSQVWNSAPNQIAKGSDDDDWSDFICNPEPMKPPIEQRNTLRQPEKTYTPEIRLSVPHLSQLQQPKKPIPVITPQGLIQTRIPSNINSLSNRNVQQPSSILQNQFKNTFQPSTISQQYQSHMNGSPFIKSNVNGYNGIIPQQQVKHNQYPPSTNVGKTAGGDDDDDWTEFISSPPVQPTKKPVNNFSQISNSPRTNTVSNSSAMPNIITNPVHFDYSLHKGKNNFGPHAKNVSRKSPNVNFGSATSSIPSISALPDLDFVGPKSRTFSKK